MQLGKNRPGFSFVVSVLVAALAANSGVSWADTGSLPRHEVDATLGLYQEQAGYNSGFWLGTRGMGIGYGFAVTDWLQLSAKTAFDIYANNEQTPGGVKLMATFGPTFNFAGGKGGISSSFFVTLGAGLNYAHQYSLAIPGTFYTTDALSTTAFAYDIEMGKRFPLLPNLAWKPSVSVTGFTGKDIFNDSTAAYPAYSIIPFRFAAIF